MEIGGFHLSRATLGSLGQVNLENQSAPAIEAMLIIDSSTFPGSCKYCSKLAAAGLSITYRALPGMIEMAFTAPQFAAVPLQMVKAMSEWLTNTASRAVAVNPLPLPTTCAPRLHLQTGFAGPKSSERPVFFGSNASLFGILTEPAPDERRRRAVLVLNAGADFHIGPSAISVSLARTWAQRGYVVLRMDFSGIGDSGTRAGTPDDEVFPSTAVQDMRAAIEYIRSRCAVRDFTIVGMCSGAYHALQAAMAELPVDRILMINPQNYFWSESKSIHGMQISELVATPSRRVRLLSVEFWHRLFAGKINASYVLTRYVRRFLFRMESSVRNLARSCGIPLPNDLGIALERIGRRGIRIVCVFASGEPGIALLNIQAGISLQRLGNRFRMHVIEGADHVFSDSEPRGRLQKVLCEELYLPVDCRRA